MSRFRRRGKNTPTMTLRVDRLDHLVLNVRDVERAAEWYAHVLGMERRDFVASAGGERRIALYAGAQKINLRPVAADPRTWLTAGCATAGSDDLCFITTGPLEDAVAHLAACGVQLVGGMGLRHGALGLMTSIYRRDPDGNLVEIAAYDGPAVEDRGLGLVVRLRNAALCKDSRSTESKPVMG